MDLASAYLRDIVRTFRNYRTLGERALAQVADEQLFVVLGEESNSLAVIVNHVAGNLRSRFTDFLTSDGEKPGRNRDAEFEAPPYGTRTDLQAAWNAAWTVTMAAVESLAPEDLSRTIYIRREAFLVVEALNRSATHTAYHVGQMVFLAKQFAGAQWTSLSIPRGRSADFGLGQFKQGIVPTAGPSTRE